MTDSQSTRIYKLSCWDLFHVRTEEKTLKKQHWNKTAHHLFNDKCIFHLKQHRRHLISITIDISISTYVPLFDTEPQKLNPQHL